MPLTACQHSASNPADQIVRVHKVMIFLYIGQDSLVHSHGQINWQSKEDVTQQQTLVQLHSLTTLYHIHKNMCMLLYSTNSLKGTANLRGSLMHSCTL